MNNYKNLTLSLVNGVMILLLLTCTSCSGSKISSVNVEKGKNVSPEKKAGVTGYSGIYRLEENAGCNIVITINEAESGCTYVINSDGVIKSGKLSFQKEGDQTYFVFNGTRRRGDKTTVEGLYTDGKILIQNYGNAMNQYVCFEKCDAKYLEFSRSR